MDNTEDIRRNMIENGKPLEDFAKDKKRKWTTDELTQEFEVLGFAAPFVVVRRKSDGVKGSMEFMHSPRVYFDFRADR
jgi:hypothetical protein